MDDQLARAITEGSPWLLPLALLGGVCTSLNPCAYPLMATVVSYIWASGERVAWRSVTLASAFLAGLVAAYCALAVVGSLVAPILGLSKQHWAWVVAGVCLVAGVFMAEIVVIELPSFSLLSRFWGRLRGYPGALLLGVLLGLVATPCATPPLVAIVSVSSAQRSVGLALLLMAAYAVGHGLPALVIALAAGRVSALERFRASGRVLQRVGGWGMIAVGVYLVATT